MSQYNFFAAVEKSFEKAAELNPTDLDNLRTLRSIYYRLLNVDAKTYQGKYDAINAQIKSL